MKKKKITSVELQVGDSTAFFEFSHAERILLMPKNGGWKLPKDSLYKLEKNGLKLKRSETTDRQSE